ncbi:MAG: SCP2 sterol-binding domain-containing protein [Deltaproteobacteria bacterium]|nr:SCP2 sterol-binding domain-containing protein [Deltaproteobacteria bacterium]
MPYTYGTPEWEEAFVKKTKERIEAAEQPLICFSPEWMGMWEKLLQGDAKYKEVAKNWEGSVILHIQKNSELGVDQDIFVWMDLWHGDCKSLRYVPREVGEKGDFVITGTLERWISVGKKQLDPVKGMMQGKLKLKGDLPTIVRNVKAAMRLVETCAEVGGKFPDELSKEEVEKFRGIVKELTTEFSITS